MALVVVLWNIYPRSLKMPKGDEHIIDWIIKKTDRKNQKNLFHVRKRASAFDKRKHRIDDVVFYCEKCRGCWSFVPGYIDDTGWREYPRGMIPTLGKKRKICIKCKEKNEDNKNTTS